MPPPRCPICGTPLAPYVRGRQHQVGEFLHCPTAAVHPTRVLDPGPCVYRPGRNGRLVPVSLAAQPAARARVDAMLGVEK